MLSAIIAISIRQGKPGGRMETRQSVYGLSIDSVLSRLFIFRDAGRGKSSATGDHIGTKTTRIIVIQPRTKRGQNRPSLFCPELFVRNST